MSRIAQWCFVHRRIVVAGWLLAAIAVLVLAKSAGSNFNSDFSLPSTDSGAAVSLLTKNFPAASGENDQIVFQTSGGATVRSAAVRADVTAALEQVAKVPGVSAVGSPYAADRAAAAQISSDGTIAFATVSWNTKSSAITTAQDNQLLSAAHAADTGTVHVSVSGSSVGNAEQSGGHTSVLVGAVAAFVILLLVFSGALTASLLPLLCAVLSLIMGSGFIDLLTHAVDTPSVATDLAVLIGLGVGVDYGLFIISRYRSGLRAGLSPHEAIGRSAATSGRTVLFAGTTVCIALLGQLALGVSFLDGISVAATIAVLLTMLTSLTFLPAMLGFLGSRALARHERKALNQQGPRAEQAGRGWSLLARFVRFGRVPVVTAATIGVVVIALPLFGMRLGSSDASNDPTSYTTYKAATTLSQGFGPGFNGPLEIAAQYDAPGAPSAFEHLLQQVARTPGVVSVTPPVASPNGTAAVATVYPTTGPQDKATADLVGTIRGTLVPTAERGTGLVVHIGGVTATGIDFAHVLSTKLPVFVAIVVLLAFVLLMVVFRSLLIPLVASVMNLLSIGAGLGALNAVFLWGWGKHVLGANSVGPIDAWLPVLMFSVLFGLSMDYEVYLVARIQEEWHAHLGRAGSRAGRKAHSAAVVTGHAKSGRVIAAAATIMILVFGSFLLGDQRSLREFGFGLAFAVLVDAFVIRGLMVPALMHLLGPANWRIPPWLGRILPKVDIEGGSAPEPVPAAHVYAIQEK
ncbi:MMPL family transporter [Catenulispora rubra]|uniref:MMPL family transporter n=1 Tax=Catenulispora rubra TaxID=280293 RepID=UPI00189272A2|nr:MMPL family transporter [Catenulispora rubra]